MTLRIPRAACGPLLLLSLLLLTALARPAASHAATGISARTCTGAATTVPGGFAAAGQWVVLENVTGQRAPRYGTSTNFTGVPLCAVRSGGATISADPQWIFCTQASLYACGQDALGAASLDPDLDPRARAEIAWAIATADLSTPTGRAVAQTRVWCVSDRVERGRGDADIVASARDYYADHGVTLPAGTACPDWDRVDPDLRTRPQLSVRPAAAQVAAGGVARFEITTNLPEVRVAASAAVDLCPDAPAGLSLASGTLRVEGTADGRARTVPLCAPAPAHLDVSAPGPLAGDLTVIRSLRSPSTCQLMVTARGTSLAAAADVTTAAAPAPAPVTAASTPSAVRTATAQSVPAAHLTIAKRRVRRTGEPRRVRSGAAVRWAITVRNTGTGDAAGVRVCDTLRRGLAALTTRPGATPSGGRVCWRLATLRAGARATLRITTRVTLPADARRCRALANRAAIANGPSASSTVTVCRTRRTRSGGTTG